MAIGQFVDFVKNWYILHIFFQSFLFVRYHILVDRAERIRGETVWFLCTFQKMRQAKE